MQVKERELIERNQDGRGTASALNSADERAVPALRNGRAPSLLHIFPSYGHGGVPIRIAMVINHFGPRYRHRIFTLDGNRAAESRLDPSLGISVDDPAIDKSRPLASLFRIRRILAEQRPDLLLTYNWGSVEWALVNGLFRVAPHIHFESGFGPEEADGQIPRRAKFRRLALARTRLLVVPSQTLVAIARDVWRIDPGKIHYVPNGVDCDLYAGPGDAAAAPGLARRDGEVIVGTLAPLRAEKNLYRLLRAFAKIATRHDNTRLLIAGDGPERAGLETAAQETGIADRVIFVGHVEQPHKVYPLMDIFAMSSDTEQMPNTLIQAMAAGRPVAAVDVGDVKVNLSPRNHPFVVPKEDEAAFATAIESLLCDPALRRELSAANLAHVKAHYSQDRMFASYGEAFDATMALAGTNG